MIQNPYHHTKKPVLVIPTPISHSQSCATRPSTSFNPFKRQHLIPPQSKSSFHFTLTFLATNRSLSKQNITLGCPTRQDKDYGRKCQSVSRVPLSSDRYGDYQGYNWQSRKKLALEDDAKRKKMEIQRKRVVLFGPDVLRYKRTDEQQKNNEYFNKNKVKTTRQNSQIKIFKESTKMYDNVMAYRQKKMKNSKEDKKIKKMLSWNRQLQEQRERKKENSKRISSQNQLQINHSEIQNKQKQNEAQSDPDTNFKNSLYNSNRSPTFGAIDHQNRQQEWSHINRVKKMASIGGGLRSSYQNGEDCIIEPDQDDFRMEGNSPVSSQTDLNQELIKAASGSYNLKHNSNFSEMLQSRNKYFSSSSGGQGTFIRNIIGHKMSYTSDQSDPIQIKSKQKTQEKIFYHGVTYELVPL